MTPVGSIIDTSRVSVVDLTAIKHFVSSVKMKGIADLIHLGRSLMKIKKVRVLTHCPVALLKVPCKGLT